RREGAAGDRARRLGVPVRYRPGARGLSGPGIRLRDPQPDAAGDAASSAGAARDAAGGAARDRGVSEFRTLVRAALDAADGAGAADEAISVRVVRVAQHPLLDG